MSHRRERMKFVKVLNIEGKDLLVFNIPIAKRTERPVYLTKQPFDNTYKRNYEGDYRCTREEVRRMFADADITTFNDSRILDGFTMEDIDLNSLKQYRQLFAAARPAHPWLANENKDFLRVLGGYRRDRVTKKEGFTLAGIIMFGKSSSITDQECVPNFFPDFREILSTDPEIRWTDRIYPDGTWEANLFQFYLKVWTRLSSSLPKPFQITKGIRQDETPAHIALREAFVNAIIHADYSAPGNIIIEHRTDTYRFSNPGTLLISLRQYYEGGISECRNPNLQKMFLMIGSAEKAGSGVSKIMSGWDYAHWRNPYILINSQPDRIVLELPMFSIIPEETLRNLHELFGEQIDALGKDELTILSTCHIEGDITNSRLQFMINLHRVDITRTLQELCKQGYLISDSKGRWTVYHLNRDYKSFTESFVDNLDTSAGNLDTSTHNLDTSAGNLDTSTHNLDTSAGNLDTSDNNLVRQIPGKLKKEDLEILILNSCLEVYRTIDEIAEKVNRKSAYIKNEVLPALIANGKLLRLYPDIPNHPNQAYKTANISIQKNINRIKNGNKTGNGKKK